MNANEMAMKLSDAVNRFLSGDRRSEVEIAKSQKFTADEAATLKAIAKTYRVRFSVLLPCAMASITHHCKAEGLV